MKNIERLQRAVDFIEEHLGEAITLSAVAEAAAFSLWHFQSVFHAVTGDTVKEYIRKRRLTRAAVRLATTQARILELALEAGFTTQESFTRAFKAQFRMTPAQCRKQGEKAIMVYGKPPISSSYLHHLSERITMQPVFRNVPAMTAIGMQTLFISGLSPDFNGLKVIPPLWKEFKQRRGEIAHLAGDGNLGVTFPHWEGKKNPPEEMLYTACAEVVSAPRIPKGMVKIEIPAGRYAVFTHRGKVENILHTMNYIYGSWLPKSELELRDAPHLELYDHRFVYNTDESELDLGVPVV